MKAQTEKRGKHNNHYYSIADVVILAVSLARLMTVWQASNSWLEVEMILIMVVY